METLAPLALVEALGPLSEVAPALAAAFARLACDIALVIDAHGVVVEAALAPGAALGSRSAWVGRHWADLAGPDSGDKARKLLAETLQHGASPRRREINHGSGDAARAVSWGALRLGRAGPVLAVGRDLAALAEQQQRLVHEQQAMEREYARLVAAAGIGAPRGAPAADAGGTTGGGAR